MASAHDAVFRADAVHHLIVRLRHNVIRAGLRRMSLAYSRISLADVAAKLGLASVQDTESIVAKAIRWARGWLRCFFVWCFVWVFECGWLTIGLVLRPPQSPTDCHCLLRPSHIAHPTTHPSTHSPCRSNHPPTHNPRFQPAGTAALRVC